MWSMYPTKEEIKGGFSIPFLSCFLVKNNLIFSSELLCITNSIFQIKSYVQDINFPIII